MNVIVFIGGLLLGTFLNIIIIRLPREQRLIGWPRCTRTGEPLVWWQMLPVAGWLMQRGHARNGKRLHWIYPFVELCTALVITLLYTTYSFSVLFFYLVFVSIVLIITGAIDWTHRYIYTFVILGAALLVLIINAIGIIPDMNLLNTGIGMIMSGGFFILMYGFAKIVFPSRSVPFGLGDVYLAVFIGAAFGMTRLVPALTYGIFLAGVASIAILSTRHMFRRRTSEYMSYGTYLCLGAIIYVLVQGW